MLINDNTLLQNNDYNQSKGNFPYELLVIFIKPYALHELLSDLVEIFPVVLAEQRVAADGL